MTKNNKKLSRSLIFVIPLLLLAGLIFLPYIEAFVLNTAPSSSPTVITPTTILNFRDVENSANSTSTVVLSSSTLTSNSETITVTDNDANFDLTAQDTVFVTVNSTTSGLAEATVLLRETTDTSGIFEGDVTLTTTGTTSGSTLQVTEGDSLTAIYLPFPYTTLVTPVEVTGGSAMDRAVGRMSASIAVTSGSGSITLSDNTVVAGFDCTWTLVTYPVVVDLPPGMVASSITIQMTYADGLLQGAASAPSGAPPLLRLLYAPIGSPTFTALTPDLPGGGTNIFGTTVDVSGHSGLVFPFNGTTKITNLVQPSSVEGQYAIGFFDAGCAGGGGGGLVRPGLVVNALAGIGAIAGAAGGGGGPPGPTVTLGAVALYDSAVEIISMPQEIRDIVIDHDPYTPLEPITDIYEDFDLPLSINGNGFALGGYENTLVTQTIEPGEPTEFVVVYYTNSELAHSSLNFNLGPTRTIQGSDIQLLLNIDKPPEIVDPNGNIASFTGSINNEGDLKRVATFLVTFSETAELPNPDMVIRSWTTSLSSGDTIVYDAIEIAQPEIVEIADEDLPEPEIQTLKSQYVPIWIKNNAAWWSQELIEDSDFVAGIEYLIQNEIMTIQDNEIIAASYSSNEIPVWIKNNAGWWSEDLITEKEFIDGLQWLISNGIIQVTELD